MMNAIDDPSIPTDEWMEAHILCADALVELEKYDEAIQTLEKLVHIIPPLPIPGLSYLHKLERKQMSDEKRDSETNDGNIKFTYDTQLKNTQSEDVGKAVVERRDDSEEDEEEKGAIKIKVTPSEDLAVPRQQRFREHDLNDTKTKLRNARPFSSSLFLSTPKGVSLFIFIFRVFEIQYLEPS